MKDYIERQNEIHELTERTAFVSYAEELQKAIHELDRCEWVLLKFELYRCFKERGFRDSKTFNYGKLSRMPE